MKNKFSTRRWSSSFSLPPGFARSGVVSNGARGSAHKAPAQAGAFTLVELLIVIATIGILAALLLPVFHSVTIHAVLQRAQSERDQIETAIQNYQSDHGFYPPGNSLASGQSFSSLSYALTNQLYYELEGTTPVVVNNDTNYTTLDSASTIDARTTIPAAFGPGISGFMNYTRGGTEDSKPAKNYLPGLPAARMATNTVAGNFFTVLVTAANSDPNYKPLPGIVTQTGANANPWRYLYPGVHNPTSYDLWIQIFIGGKTNLISNWKTDPEVNPALP